MRKVRGVISTDHLIGTCAIGYVNLLGLCVGKTEILDRFHRLALLPCHTERVRIVQSGD